MQRVLVPSGAGVGSAIGFLRAPVGYEVVRSLYQRFSSFDVAAVNALLADMAAEALAVVAQGGFGAPTTQTPHRLYALCRPGPRDPGAAAARATLGDSRRAAIRAAYDTRIHPLLRPPGARHRRGDHELRRHGGDRGARTSRHRPVRRRACPRTPIRRPGWCATRRPARSRDWPVYDRAALAPGALVAGPAIIAEDETCTLVGPGLDAPSSNGLGYHRADAGDRVMSKETGALAQIHRQIMWNRLIAVVEEQAQTMIRTAFSTTVREAGDLSAGIFDLARPHDGAGRHRHARPRQLDGGKRRPLPARNSPSTRCSRATTTSPTTPGSAPATCTTSPSSRPAFHNGADRRPVRQHRARHRCRRPRHGAGGPLGLRGRHVHPDRQMLRPGPAERDLLRLHPRRHRACRSSWRATSTRCAPATTPARTAWPR